MNDTKAFKLHVPKGRHETNFSVVCKTWITLTKLFPSLRMIMIIKILLFKNLDLQYIDFCGAIPEVSNNRLKQKKNPNKKSSRSGEKLRLQICDCGNNHKYLQRNLNLEVRDTLNAIYIDFREGKI